MIGKREKLNIFELQIAYFMGKKRYENARRKGIKNVKMGDQSNAYTDVNSAAGEIVFGKMFNLYPDFQFEKLNDYDFILPDGRTVDVKTTHYPRGKLVATLKTKKKAADLYALIIGNVKDRNDKEEAEFIFHGFIKKENFLIKKNIGNLGKGDGYLVFQDMLKELEDL